MVCTRRSWPSLAGDGREDGWVLTSAAWTSWPVNFAASPLADLPPYTQRSKTWGFARGDGLWAARSDGHLQAELSCCRSMRKGKVIALLGCRHAVCLAVDLGRFLVFLFWMFPILSPGFARTGPLWKWTVMGEGGEEEEGV